MVDASRCYQRLWATLLKRAEVPQQGGWRLRAVGPSKARNQEQERLIIRRSADRNRPGGGSTRFLSNALPEAGWPNLDAAFNTLQKEIKAINAGSKPLQQGVQPNRFTTYSPQKTSAPAGCDVAGSAQDQTDRKSRSTIRIPCARGVFQRAELVSVRLPSSRDGFASESSMAIRAGV